MSETIFNSSTIIRRRSQYFNNHGGIDLFEASSLSFESLFNKIRNDANTLLPTSSTQSDVFLSSYFMIAMTFSSSSSSCSLSVLFCTCDVLMWVYAFVCVTVSLVYPGWWPISFRHGLSSRSDHINMCEFVCSKTVNEWKKNNSLIYIYEHTALIFSFLSDPSRDRISKTHFSDTIDIGPTAENARCLADGWIWQKTERLETTSDRSLDLIDTRWTTKELFPPIEYIDRVTNIDSTHLLLIWMACDTDKCFRLLTHAMCAMIHLGGTPIDHINPIWVIYCE